MRAIVEGFVTAAPGNIFVVADYMNGTSFVETYGSSLPLANLNTPSDIITAATAAINAYAASQSYTLSEGIVWAVATIPYVQSVTQAKSFNSAPARSIVTGTGATGFQVSATRDAQVSYSPTMVTTASISGNASDVIVLEICPTNSATAGNWVEIGRVTNAQALSLAITLQSVQTTSGALTGIVPAGYYAKLRAVTSGTVSNSFSSGQEVLL